MQLKHIISYLIAALFFFASWTDAFAIVAWISVPIVIACILILIMLLLQGRGVLNDLQDSDKIAILMIILILISAIYNSNTQSITSVFTYIIAFIFLNIFLRKGIMEYGSYSVIKIANILGVFFIITFIYLDFYFEFFIGNSLQNYLPRTGIPSATYFIFPRAYAFSEEPTYLGWYLNTLGVMAVYHLRQIYSQRKLIMYLVVIYFFGGWLLTFSAATFVFLPLSIGLVWILFVFKNNGKLLLNYKLIFVIILTIIIIVTIVSVMVDTRILQLFFGQMLEKVSFRNTDHNIRGIRLISDLAIAFQNLFFGKGIGYLSSLDRESSLNLFLFLFLEAGIGSVSLLILFYALKFRDIIISNSHEAYIYAVTFTAWILLFTTLTQIYHLNLWLLLAMFQLSINNQTHLDAKIK